MAAQSKKEIRAHPQAEESEYVKLAKDILKKYPDSTNLGVLALITETNFYLDTKLTELYENEDMTDSDITDAKMGLINESRYNIRCNNGIKQNTKKDRR